MYNLLSAKLLICWSVSDDPECLYCTVQDLKYAPCSKYHWLSILGADWLLSVTFSEVPGSNVDDSLDGAYLGPFLN